MNIKVLINYALLFLISFGLAACNHDENGFQGTIVAANTPAVISGTTTGSISGTDTVATGTLSVTDPDTGEAAFQTQTDNAQTYGSFSITSGGQWTYTLDRANAAFVALDGGEEVTETITVTTAGQSTQNITITLTGVNDVAVFGGDNSADTLSNNSDPVTGTLTLTDPDTTPDTIVAQTSVTSTYGTFSITADGAWTYTLNTTNPAVLALTPASDPLTDVIPVSSADGLTSNVTITINPAPVTNTPATFAGDTTGSINVGDMETTGTVTVTDPDAGENVMVAQTNAGQTYGSFSIGTDGAWIYVLDNSNTAVQALAAGETLTDTVAIASGDNTAGAVTITINGAVAAVATFRAVLQNPDMQTYHPPSDGTNTNDLVDAWTIDPDNNFDNGLPTPFNFWRNDALETWVSDPANNGGAGTTDKGSSSGTDAMSAGGTSDRSLKFDSSGERAYQPFEVETGVEYTISAFVKSETTPVGQVEGTFYILSGEPVSDTELPTYTLISHQVIAGATPNTWQQVNFSFTADSTFSFPQSRVDENTDDILVSTDQKFVIFYFVPTNTVLTTNEVFLTDIILDTPSYVPPPTATFAAAIQNADMQTYHPPSDGTNTNDLVDAWTIDPDNNFDNGLPTPFNFWRNDALESWVSDPANNGGAGTTDKGSSSGTDAMSAGGTSDRSLKFDSSGERAYQPFEVETGIEYSITAFVKSETTAATEVEGTFYILSGEPVSDTELPTYSLVSEQVIAGATPNTWQQVSFSFTADTTFSFPQSRVDENADDILVSTDQKFVIIYFVPTNTVLSTNEVFVTDVVISTPGF